MNKNRIELNPVGRVEADESQGRFRLQIFEECRLSGMAARASGIDGRRGTIFRRSAEYRSLLVTQFYLN